VTPIIPDPKRIKSFRTEGAFETWMRANHARETELWLKIYKKGSGVATVTTAQALDVALCWGWIDGIRKAFDDRSFLQRYSPRRPRSMWSQINREHVARLTAAGRMTPHGQRQVDAARADGRWDAAYAPIRSATKDTIPADLRAAIEASPRARETFRRLGRLNLFALAFRTNNMKTPAGRATKIAALVAMLERGETIVPERRAEAERGRRMTPDGFRRIALGLVGAVESVHHGHPDFRAGGRIFATLGYPDRGWGMVNLTPDQQRTQVREHPDAFVPAKGTWGEQGSTTVRLDAVDEETLGEALTLAWQNAVAKARARASTRKRAANRR
jgi:uncharacterized protein YdeI (YjbR/CyaY-like superfamily)